MLWSYVLSYKLLSLKQLINLKCKTIIKTVVMFGSKTTTCYNFLPSRSYKMISEWYYMNF
ncbi:hypothetical protein BpHYR1_027796 [Brachionus plicatilis]|uniref:Uncharacterized protein n=1 Tax=Brachionus plicatilis TaxID=10195 RepID=A0A3M7RU96_BRAPC|nr:hypothetical protein BpHYR1_027796 [Brachionus plicatilis]